MGNPDRFWSKVKIDADWGCWVWQGAVQGKYYNRPGGGYGSVRWNGKVRPAHRVAWELIKGNIPDGLHIDHLCRNTRCVNPDHMELVTNAENHRRGEAYKGTYQKSKTHCPHGHEYTEENTMYMSKGKGSYPYRVCKTCRRRIEEKANERRRAKRAAARISATGGERSA